MSRILCIVAAFLSAVLLSFSCGKEQDIFCEVTLRVFVEGDPDYVSIEIDPSLQGNMFRNLNTYQDYSMPAIIGGTASMRVLKGLYMIAFDGTIHLSDGSRRTVRFSRYNSPDKAIYLLEESATIEMELTLL